MRNTETELLCTFAGLGFEIRKNGHQSLLIYFKDAFIDEIPEYEATPEAVQGICQDYWAEINGG